MNNKEALKEIVEVAKDAKDANIIIHDILKLMNNELYLMNKKTEKVKLDVEFNLAFMCVNIIYIYALLLIFSIKYYYS